LKPIGPTGSRTRVITFKG